MKSLLALLLFPALLVSASGATAQAAAESTDAFQRPAAAPHPEGNPYTPGKFALGRKLFFDPRLSRDNDISCATCHNPARGWEDGRVLARGSEQAVHERHSPTLENLAWSPALLWDGRAPTLESQVWFPLTAQDEMAQDVGELMAELGADPDYLARFGEVFPDRGISLITLSAAIATFEREIVSAEAPFDRWVAGDEQAISPRARQGFTLFFGKAGCAGCHSGWRFTDDSFHDTGLPASEDTGRFRFSREPGDRFAFKTPGLRNLALRAPYMHNGSMPTLEAVIGHYNGSRPQRPSLSPLLSNPQLSEDDISALLSFLDTLNSDSGTQVP